MTGARVDARARRDAVAGFFGERSRRWRDLYQRTDFDARNFRMRAEIALRWLRAVQPTRNAHLLEVGSGAGAQAQAAAALGWSVYCVDLSMQMLQQAKTEMAGPCWANADGDALPFADASFDAILLNGVIGYVADPVVTLRELRRVLRPGGSLVISWVTEYPGLERASGAVSAVGDVVYLALKRLVTGKRPVPVDWRTGFYANYLRYWNERDFCLVLREAGFRVDALRAINFGQIRFMDRALWPEAVDVGLSAALEWCAELLPLRGCRNFAKTHLALARSDQH